MSTSLVPSVISGCLKAIDKIDNPKVKDAVIVFFVVSCVTGCLIYVVNETGK